MNKTEEWKSIFRYWNYIRNLPHYEYIIGFIRKDMLKIRREAALERALAAANRRAERAEARVNELEYVINLDDKSLEVWLGKIE